MQARKQRSYVQDLRVPEARIGLLLYIWSVFCDSKINEVNLAIITNLMITSNAGNEAVSK
jgi:hypothetical protein